MTAYVRGQWNWLSHDIATATSTAPPTGLAMIWNDSTETGYTLTGKTVSADVGVATKTRWADP